MPSNNPDFAMGKDLEPSATPREPKTALEEFLMLSEELDTALQLLGDAVLSHHDYVPPPYMARQWEDVDAALIKFNEARSILAKVPHA